MTSEQPLGWIYEIFTSIQGEGLYCGQRQTFIRLAGCNLSCTYCDTAYARKDNPISARIETSPGRGIFTELTNPISVDSIITACRKSGAGVAAITGGEPLMQPHFLKPLMRELKASGLRTYLETNGTLHEELSPVIDVTDVVAMDIKLPSAGGEELWNAHKRFLAIARTTEVFVKAVVSTDTPDEEVRKCAELISSVDPAIVLVIQPMSGKKFTGNSLMKLQEAALDKLEDVRVIPQCHKVLGLL